MKKQIYIDKLLEALDSEFEPELVPIILEDFSKERNCFYNVQKKVKMDDGNVHYGWVLHENEFFYEAEKHAVWENDNADLIDVTPQNGKSTNEILFVSDNKNFIYQGQYIPNVRVNSTKNNLVNDYIFILSKIDYLYTLTKRVNELEIEIPEPVKILIEELDYLGNIYYTYLKSKRNERSRCFCNSSKIYKNCHGEMVKVETEDKILLLKKYLQNN